MAELWIQALAQANQALLAKELYEAAERQGDLAVLSRYSQAANDARAWLTANGYADAAAALSASGANAAQARAYIDQVLGPQLLAQSGLTPAASLFPTTDPPVRTVTGSTDPRDQAPPFNTTINYSEHIPSGLIAVGNQVYDTAAAGNMLKLGLLLVGGVLLVGALK